MKKIILLLMLCASAYSSGGLCDTNKKIYKEKSIKFNDGEEITVGALFFPILAEIERWPTDDKISTEADIKKMRKEIGRLASPDHPQFNLFWISEGCRIFSNKKYVYGQNQGQQALNQNGSVAYFIDEPLQVKTSDNNMNSVWINNKAKDLVGEPAMPGKTVACMIAYSKFIGEAARELAKGASVHVDKFSGNRVFYVQNLQEKARNALFNAFETKFNQSSSELNKFNQNKYCIIPTPTAVMQRQGRVTCGEYEYDQYSIILNKNGVNYLSNDTVLGKKMFFADAGN